MNRSGVAVQRGSLIYVYDERGRQTTTLLAGDGLQGCHTSGTVSVRRGSSVMTDDRQGRRLSSTPRDEETEPNETFYVSGWIARGPQKARSWSRAVNCERLKWADCGR
jgi:hypothetical protein